MKLKKIICVILSLVFAFGIMIPCFSALNLYNTKNDAVRFSSEIQKMNRSYNRITAEKFINPDGSKNYTAYESRLIIESDCKIYGTKEAEAVYGCGYAVLQYEDDAAMEADRKALLSRGYSVSVDKMIFANDTDERGITAKYTDSGNYGYYDSGATYAQESIENSGKEYDDIVIGVLDSGVNYNHELLSDRIVDTTLNFSRTGEVGDCMDDQGHGTLVSGIIVQSTPDNVKIKPYKLLDNMGSATESNMIAACEYILAENDKPDILNMSIGGYDLYNEDMFILKEEVQKLVDCGITVCVAAGNEAVPSDYVIPGGVEDVITVSSHGDSGVFSEYSDYGKMIDVCAPGEYIYSSTIDGGYSSDYSGTSFSCPFTAAACAYIIMQHPDYTPAQVQEKIKATAIYQGEDDSYYYGAGILSFSNLIDDKTYETPKPSIEGGLYHQKQTISFDVPLGTELVYSTSRIPTENEKTYTKPFTIESDTVLHYALVVKGRYVSPIESTEYIVQYYADKSEFTVSLGTIKSYNGDKTNIVVPDNISATSVYAYAFQGSPVKSIVLPDKITILGTGCFQDSFLRHITAPGVTRFSGENVFYNCRYLQEEIMPKLATVTESAFKGCKRLNTIDFGENITRLKTSLFEDSGLLYGDFPNAQITLTSNENVFKNASLFTCSIPKIDEIGVSFFEGCKYLYDLNISPVKILRAKGISYCNFLKYFDFSTLEKLYSNGLYGAAVKYFYAPKINGFADDGTQLAEYCNCGTIDMPNFTAKLKSEFLLRSCVREIRFENVTDVSSGAFKNTPFLSRIYLPNAISYFAPATVTTTIDNMYNQLGIYYNKYPNQEIVWIPKATSLQSIMHIESVSLFYAPSTTSVYIEMGDSDKGSVFVFSNSTLKDDVIFVSSSEDGIKRAPKVVASCDSSLNTADKVYDYVSVDNVEYLHFKNSDFIYSADGVDFSIPNDYIRGFWSTGEINKSRNQSQYSFILDFTNDNIINAKDFSVYYKNIDL
ncbi:MAG: S8 family serine peptidase [Eubacterium sp.]